MRPPEPAKVSVQSADARGWSQYYGASKYGSGPQSIGNRRCGSTWLCPASVTRGLTCSCVRSPRESYNPEAENFKRERGSYQSEMEHPVRKRTRKRDHLRACQLRQRRCAFQQ